MIHNPGCIPDDGLLTGADCIVVFESSLSEFTPQQTQLQSLITSPRNNYSRGNYAYMINSVPTTTDMKTFLGNVGSGAEYLFVTNLGIDSDMYEKFGDDWNAFILGMTS